MKLFIRKYSLILILVIFNCNCSSDKNDWKKAKSEDVVLSYKNYILLHSEGKFINEAYLEIEKLDFEKAERLNTIPAYEEFLKIHPKGSNANEARQIIENIYEERNPFLRNVKRIKITVNEAYYYENGLITIKLPFKILSSFLFECAGISVENENSSDYDAILNIQAIGNALSAYYVPGRVRFSGASISGDISLKVQEKTIYKETFTGTVDPPHTLVESDGSHEFQKPSSAPFIGAFNLEDSFRSTIYKMMGELFGAHCIINALNCFNSRDIGSVMEELIPAIQESENNDEKIAYNSLVNYALNMMPMNAGFAIKELKAVDWKPEDYNEKVAFLLTEYQIVSLGGQEGSQLAEIIKIGKPALRPLIWAITFSDDGIQASANRALKGLSWKPINMKDNIAYLLSSKFSKETSLHNSDDEIVKIGKPAVNVLINAVSENWYHKDTAIQLLGRIGDDRAVEPLITVLDDTNGGIRNEVEKALNKITGKQFGQDQQQWFDWWKQNKIR